MKSKLGYASLILLYSVTISRKSGDHQGYIRFNFIVGKQYSFPQGEPVVLGTECLLYTVLCLECGVSRNHTCLDAVWDEAPEEVGYPGAWCPAEALMACDPFLSQSVSLAGNSRTSHMPRWLPVPPSQFEHNETQYQSWFWRQTQWVSICCQTSEAHRSQAHWRIL